MKISNLRALFHTQLSPLYDQREIDAIFFTYIDYTYNIKKHHFFLDADFEIDDEGRRQKAEGRRQKAEGRSELEALADGCPIQYIIGKTTFCNFELEVNPSVLIPRPETEELVAMILKAESRKQKAEKNLTLLRSYVFTVLPPKILDFCTGSGAIAIALAKNIENAEVWATDNSTEAIETAKKNADMNRVEVRFLLHDVLNAETNHDSPLPDEVDIIVSNPPYIPLNERAHLHKNVVNYEPYSALFVPDKNPLLFYRAIAQIAKKILRCGGSLYFETHEHFQSELSAMLSENNFHEIELGKDLNGKPRFISCKKL